MNKVDEMVVVLPAVHKQFDNIHAYPSKEN
jgi:hypothetical protein